MKHVAPTAIVIAALVAGAPALASPSHPGLSGPSTGAATRNIGLQLRFSGSITVAFHGDPADGCAAIGDCAYNGVESWSPDSEGLLALTRHGSAAKVAGVLDLGTRWATAAEVQRAGAGGYVSCTDASSPMGLSGVASIRAGRIVFRLLAPGGDLLATRCAGPTDTGLAPFAATAAISLAAALKGNQSVSLRQSVPFAADGYAGTLTSTVAIHLGKSALAGQLQTFLGGAAGAKAPRIRTLTERLAVRRVSGTIAARFAGARTPAECAPLDACGATGIETLTPSAASGTGSLSAAAPARRPIAVARRVLGLGGDVAHANGSVPLTQGRDTSTFVEDGDSCHGTGPLGAGTVLLTVAHGRILGVYQPSPGRDPCPGPLLPQASVAIGSAPASVLAHRTFTLHLRAVRHVDDGGYEATLSGGITIDLRRGAVTTSVF